MGPSHLLENVSVEKPGLIGGSSGLGHEQESLLDVGIPEFEHAGGFRETIAVREATGVSESHKLTNGNQFQTQVS